MGVPALFRWLSQKYPKVTTPVVEEDGQVIDGVEIPIDWSQPNPNGMELDNLYLDMNGIIHPCCHPEDKPAPETEDEMYAEIFKYIDRIMAMMRPRKLVYMAIDGVAPRAKMNQQRSRRFRAAQEATEKKEKEDAEAESSQDVVPVEEKSKPFDSNCITPGTPFMEKLAVALRYYITDRMQTNSGWKNLKVILSDASSPGEGEHKIMHYIRHQRTQPTHDPNTTHVLYGLDADLIMLALATHEPHFRILREDVFTNEKDDRNKCYICGQEGHQAAVCTGKAKVKDGEFDEKRTAQSKKPYVFLHVPILREYLEAELSFPPNSLGFEWNLERAIDDWVFLVFFVGNDFLPHLPSLEIREGAIDTLVNLWKKVLPSLGGFITKNGEVRLERVEQVLYELGKVEADIFKRRREKEERRMANEKARKEQQGQSQRSTISEVPEIVSPLTTNFNSAAYATKIASTHGQGLLVNNHDLSENQASNKDLVEQRREMRAKANQNAAAALRAKLGKRKEPDEVEELEEPPLKRSVSAPVLEDEATPLEEPDVEATEDDDDDVEESMTVAEVPIPHVDRDIEPHDEVRLWETGWKQRYYQSKFGVDENDMGKRRDVVRSYVEGFCWVLKYYYQGVQSWKWYFPEHYAPFASDFTNLDEFDPIKFDLGTPFKPFEQLMGVLPAASRWHIPEIYHALMLEETSPIIDFYPETFDIDLNGKRHAWQGVALLPFIEEKRLLKAMETKSRGLTLEEEARNSMGDELLFVSDGHVMFDLLCTLYKDEGDEEMVQIENPKLYFLAGSLFPDSLLVPPGSTFHSPLSSVGLPDIHSTCISAAYLHPKLPSKNYEFKSELLPGVKLPPKVLTHDDIARVRYGRGGGYQGRNSPSFRGRGGGYSSDRGGYRGRGRGGYQNNPSHHQQPQHHALTGWQPNPAYSQGGYGGGGYQGGYQPAGYGGYQQYPQQGYPLQHPSFPSQSYPPQPPSFPPQGYQGYSQPYPPVPPPSLPPRPNLAWNRNLQQR